MPVFFRIVFCLVVTLALCHFFPGESQSDDYQDYLKAQAEDFQSYKDERDAEFIGFLKDQWREYNIDKGMVQDSKPKPLNLPVAEPAAAPALPKKLKKVKKVVIPRKKPIGFPAEIPVDTPEAVIAEKPSVKVEPLKDIPVVPPVEKPYVKPFERVVETPVEIKKPEPLPQLVKPVPPMIARPEDKPFDREPDKTVVKPSSVKEDTRQVAIQTDFYMIPVVIYGTYNFPVMSGNSVNKELIASFWDRMSQLDYDSIISQTQKYRSDMKLNDWGYHYILYRLGLELYRGNKNMANLFTWYMSSKAGYESRIGYNDTQVFLLMPSKNNLYSIPFLTMNNKKYYSLFFDDKPSAFKSLFTYKGSYPDAKKTLDFELSSSPEIPKVMKQRNLTFDLNKKGVEVNTVYNKNIVDFFKYYPQTNMKVYFESFMSPELEYALLTALKPMVEGKTEAEAVNNLLCFVQKAFSYKTDDGQFGHEKYMLPEETVFYPFSDCEDRSFFFAYLVRKLVGLEVVGLDYPGHVATGVRFNDNLPGDYVVSNNVKYMVCDPTYINATLGMAMPQYKKTQPDVVKIR